MSLTSINVNNTLVTSVDSEPTAGSDNLVKSGGVAKKLTELESKMSNVSHCAMGEYIMDLAGDGFANNISYDATNGSPTSTDTRKSSDVIKVQKGDIVDYTLYQYTGSLMVIAFDANKNVIIGKSVKGVQAFTSGSIVVDDEIKAVAFSAMALNNTYKKCHAIIRRSSFDKDISYGADGSTTSTDTRKTTEIFKVNEGDRFAYKLYQYSGSLQIAVFDKNNNIVLDKSVAGKQKYDEGIYVVPEGVYGIAFSAMSLNSIYKGCFANSINKNKRVNAFDYGFSPENDGYKNAETINKALYGGNRTVEITAVGTYDLANTIYLDSNTELVCDKGVVLSKNGNYVNVFLNRNAIKHEYNENITFKGVNIEIAKGDVEPYEDSSLYGLRGQVAFMCMRNLKLLDFTLHGLKPYQFGVHINQAEYFTIDDFDIRGEKDGVHLSDVQHFEIKNGRFQTVDDAIGLNANDFYTSNCVNGSIQYGLIENVTDLSLSTATGYGLRFLLGAWVDWHNGVSVRQGDLFINNGNLYKALCDNPDSSFTSQTEPTISNYEGTQLDSSGFRWKLCRKNASYYRADCSDITIRRYTDLNSYRSALIKAEVYENAQRTLHPEVSVDNYPKNMRIVIDNLYTGRSNNLFVRCSKAHTNVHINDVKGYTGYVQLAGGEDGVEGIAYIDNFDFAYNQSSIDITCGNNSLLKLGENNRIKRPLKKYGDDGRVVSKTNLDANPANPNRGDYVIVQNVHKIYNGNEWIVIA